MLNGEQRSIMDSVAIADIHSHGSMIAFVDFLNRPTSFISEDVIHHHLGQTSVDLTYNELKFSLPQIDQFLFDSFVRQLTVIEKATPLVESLLSEDAILAGQIALAPRNILETFSQCIAAAAMHVQLSSIIFKADLAKIERALSPEAITIGFSEANLLYSSLSSLGDTQSIFSQIVDKKLEDEELRGLFIEFGQRVATAFLSSISTVWAKIYSYRFATTTSLQTELTLDVRSKPWTDLKKIWERKCQSQLNS